MYRRIATRCSARYGIYPTGRLEATLEAERGDRRRLDRDQQRQREAETLAYEQAIKVRTQTFFYHYGLFVVCPKGVSMYLATT